ncbi:HTH_Tnp_Tc3_2 domain-containing protein [Trichonephila clavipes]|nr:HTH_Tnp_Tc3_2 domain-containing protein [Trichonephila clavipes]
MTWTKPRGCGSPVVKVSNHGRHVMSSIPVPLKTRRVGQRCTLNLSRAETSSRCWKYPRNLETPRVISRLWQRFQDDGNVSKCYSTGRPRVTTPNEDRYFAVTSKGNRRSTASDLSRQLSSATGTTVSRQNVYRRLGHIGLYARRPVRCVPLTATHCRLRLTWSREALWTP